MEYKEKCAQSLTIQVNGLPQHDSISVMTSVKGQEIEKVIAT